MSLTTRAGRQRGQAAEPGRSRRTRHAPRRSLVLKHRRPSYRASHHPAWWRRWWRRWTDLRTWRPYAALLAVVVAAGVLAGVAVYSTSWAGVKTVEVSGTHYVSAAQVRSAAAIERGRPLVRLNTGAIASRVRALGPVASVSVARHWPSTVRITVTERRPVAYAERSGKFWLLDRTAIPFHRVSPAPHGLTRIDLRTAGRSVGGSPAAVSDADRASVAVAAQLPPSITRLVAIISAPSQDAVTLHLRSGRTVIWGTPQQSAAKARVLPTLLGRPGTTFDLSGLPNVAVRSGG
ncbi:MAG: cell division protein FtsQ/DivIB [Mycobacteriales bacterium]